MSDQGERGTRWTEMSESESDTGHGPEDPRAGAETGGPQVAFPEARVPEVRVPPPSGRTDFSEPAPSSALPSASAQPVPHDVWGKVEGPSAPPSAPSPPPSVPEPEPAAEPEPEPALPEAVLPELAPQEPAPPEQPTSAPPAPEPPTPPASEPMTFPPAPPVFAPPSYTEPAPEPPAPPAEAEDVKVAPVPEESPQWEGSLFEDGDGGDPRYQAAVLPGADAPARPGKPSSGNWQMPDWMADESAADAKLGGSPMSAHGELDGGGGKTRLALFGGVGLLVVALVAAGGVYLLKGGDEKAKPKGKASSPTAERPAGEPRRPQDPQVKMPPDKRLRTFSGRPSRVLGRVTDARSGLSWPRLAPPWQVPTKRNKLGTPGWSGQQVMVTERRGKRLWFGQLLTGTLPPLLEGGYKGPESVKVVSVQAAKGYEEQYYGFPHRTTPLASQALTVDGRRGWLVASYLTYRRGGVRATGEIVATAVIDTGRPKPAVVFASLPNTHKTVWPDLKQFLDRLKVAA